MVSQGVQWVDMRSLQPWSQDVRYAAKSKGTERENMSIDTHNAVLFYPREEQNDVMCRTTDANGANHSM